MDWINFPVYAGITFLTWFLGAILIGLSKKGRGLEYGGLALVIAGNLIMIFFAILLWVHLERPPLRTLGETRLWQEKT